MALAPRGLTIVFPATANFSTTGAKEVGPGFQIRIHNTSSDLAWVFWAATEAEANAAAISTDVAPTPSISMVPGSVEVFQTPFGNTGKAFWVNACTVNGTGTVNVTPGSGEP